MTRKEFLELGNYIACLSNRTTIYNGRRLKIKIAYSNMFTCLVINVVLRALKMKAIKLEYLAI